MRFTTIVAIFLTGYAYGEDMGPISPNGGLALAFNFGQTPLGEIRLVHALEVDESGAPYTLWRWTGLETYLVKRKSSYVHILQSGRTVEFRANGDLWVGMGGVLRLRGDRVVIDYTSASFEFDEGGALVGFGRGGLTKPVSREREPCGRISVSFGDQSSNFITRIVYSPKGIEKIVTQRGEVNFIWNGSVLLGWEGCSGAQAFAYKQNLIESITSPNAATILWDEGCRPFGYQNRWLAPCFLKRFGEYRYLCSVKEREIEICVEHPIGRKRHFRSNGTSALVEFEQ